uniref:MIF4G domain-containing protein n=1 Tax=viral metagenome TaxID=1070528 RepID=A0A6C0EP98_9ZZZZ
MTTDLKYNLTYFNNLIFSGFNYEIPENTMKKISDISLEVGSPSYVKTPVFQKKENLVKSGSEDGVISVKKKRGNRSMEVNDEDWENIRSFQTTKIEQKTGLDGQIDLIRSYLNKISDKNFNDIKSKIVEVIDKLVLESVDENDIRKVSLAIFEIASNNRFYSKLYADLYCFLISKYDNMKPAFEDSLKSFMGLFNTIEYIDPAINYNEFCRINKENEKRKSLSAFFINLMKNEVIDKETIIQITRNLMALIYEFISTENKKNEVDELSENVAILFNKELYQDDGAECYDEIDGFTITEVIEKIAKSKVKDYKSLTNKTLFKFMDMIDM